eukprot:6489619-Amphidinium_carterae.1
MTKLTMRPVEHCKSQQQVHGDEKFIENLRECGMQDRVVGSKVSKKSGSFTLLSSLSKMKVRKVISLLRRTCQASWPTTWTWSGEALPVGSFLGEGHSITSEAFGGLEIGLLCMLCGAYSAGNWGLLKSSCGLQLGGRSAQLHRIQSGRFPDNKVKCPVILGPQVYQGEVFELWKAPNAKSRQLWKL